MNNKTTQLKTEEELIRDAKRAYHREYRKKNRKRILEQQKQWRADNPDKVAAINHRYWVNKAKENLSEK